MRLIAVLRVIGSRPLRLGWLLVASCAWSPLAMAEFFIPQSLGGSIGYNYGYNQVDTSESERSSINLGINMSGYFWEPWFMTGGGGLGLSLSDAVSNTGGTSKSSSVSGDLNFTLFPSSRFPTDFGYSVTTSESESVENSLASNGQSYRVRRGYIRQLYTTEDNMQLTAWLNQSIVESDTRADSEIWTLGLEGNKRYSYQSVDSGLHLNQSRTPETGYESRDGNFFINHGYYPGTDIGAISQVNVNRTSNSIKARNQVTGATSTSSSETSSAQIGSNIYWRPEHRPYYVSGGVRFSRSSSDNGGEVRGASTSVATTYRYSRNTRFSGSIFANVNEYGDQQSTSVSESLNSDYSSDPYRFYGFNYSWGAGAGVSNTNQQVEGGQQQQQQQQTDTTASGDSTSPEGNVQTVNASLSHRLARPWILSKYSTLSFNIGQGVGGSKASTEKDPAYSVNHSTGVTWNRSAPGSQTSASLSGADTRSYAKDEIIYQTVMFQLSQQQSIDRLSGITGSVNYQASKSESTPRDGSTTNTSGTTTDSTASSNYNNGEITETGSVGLSYFHSRFLGIYRLRFNSTVTTRGLFSDQNNNTQSSGESNVQLDWRNDLTYNIGLLTASMNFNVSDLGDGRRSKSFFFHATRNF